MSTKKKQDKRNERFVVKGKAFWAHITEVNKLSQKYQVDLSIDRATAAQLEDYGIDIKTNDKDDEGKPENHRGQYVTLKSEYPPKIYDSKRNEVTKKILVGNGSEVNIATHVYDWKFGKDNGTALGLDAIQIVELVSYKDATGDLFDSVDGYDSADDEAEETDSSEYDESRTPPVSKDNPF